MITGVSRSPRIFACITAVWLSAISGIESAKARYSQSVEMTVISTPLVVRGTIQSAEVYGRPRGDIDQTRVVVRVKEILKGTAPDPVIVAVYEMSEDAPIRREDVGRDMLLFLQSSRLGAAERRDCAGCEWELATPPEGGYPPQNVPQFIDLSGLRPQTVWNSDLKQLYDPKQILAAARAASVLGKCDTFDVTLLNGESISIPDTASLAERADDWSRSEDPNKRCASVDVLRAVDLRKAEPALRRLLSDPYVEWSYSDRPQIGPWTRQNYAIRARAWDAIKNGDVGAGKPALSVDPGTYRPIPIFIIGICFVGVLAIGSVLMLRRFFARQQLSRGAGWWIWSTGAGVLLLFAGIYSSRNALDLVDGDSNSIHGLTLVCGEFQWRHLTLNAANKIEPKRVWTLFRLDHAPAAWHGYAPPELASKTLAWDFAGFSVRSGTAPFPVIESLPALPVQYVSMPLWPLMVLSLMPALFALSRRRRISRLMAAGRCPHCGYDLRASSDCCSECGNAITARSNGLVASRLPDPSIFSPTNS